MKKIIIFIPILFFLTLFAFNANDVFASNCQRIGNTTFCDDGTNYQQIGNTVFGSDGTNYQRIGNTTFGSDGTNYQQIGNTTFGSDGTSYQRIGNTTFGSDGSSYQTIGNTTFGSGNVYNSCPTNSSYNSSTGKCSCNYGYSVNYNKTSCVYTGTTYSAPTTPTCPLNSYYDGVSSCKCNYGYVVSGSSCVYQGTSYSNTSAYSAPQNTCPINSHTSVTDSTKCQCNVGYQPNTTNDGCVPAPTKTNDQRCKDEFGVNSNWDGTGTVEKGLGCGCKTGYVWNTQRTSCVIAPVVPIKTNDQLCQDDFGKNVSWDGTKTSDGNLNCNCKTDYVWNSARTACVLPPTISTPTKTETKVITPALPVKKDATTTQSGSGTGNGVPWYQRMFGWLFK
jgi:hypothetical protein